MMYKPTIYLHPETKEDLGSYYDQASDVLEKFFAVQPWSPAGDLGAGALADEVAAALESVCCSTDQDCDYYPCVIEGIGAMNTDFFTALGIDPNEVLEYKIPRLDVEVGDGFNTMEFLTRFVAADQLYETIDAYFSKKEQDAFAKAAKLLDGIGDVTSVELATDNSCVKLRFTLAWKSSAAAYIGVLTALVET